MRQLIRVQVPAWAPHPANHQTDDAAPPGGVSSTNSSHAGSANGGLGLIPSRARASWNRFERDPQRHASPPPAASGDVTERLVWIDWLKIIVVFAVFVYHAAEPFLVINWVVSNDERSVALSAIAGFGFLFGCRSCSC